MRKVLSLLNRTPSAELKAVFGGSTMIEGSLRLPANGLAPMEVTLAGILTLVIKPQFQNAPVSMLTTLLGIVRLVSPGQSAKDWFPIEVTPLPRATLVRPQQPKKAVEPILVV